MASLRKGRNDLRLDSCVVAIYRNVGYGCSEQFLINREFFDYALNDRDDLYTSLSENMFGHIPIAAADIHLPGQSFHGSDSIHPWSHLPLNLYI